jgi:UDP-N-acetylmuramoyl-L-alanyl-D-glutamate--2,6-diaminopimelate ligase
MGEIAARLADRVYVTSDNPRTEDPQTIVDEIVGGIQAVSSDERADSVIVELDRRAAIERAVLEAQRGDAILIAGKGHEDYQIIGNTVFPFDDVVVAREALARRGAKT